MLRDMDHEKASFKVTWIAVLYIYIYIYRHTQRSYSIHKFLKFYPWHELWVY